MGSTPPLATCRSVSDSLNVHHNFVKSQLVAFCQLEFLIMLCSLVIFLPLSDCNFMYILAVANANDNSVYKPAGTCTFTIFFTQNHTLTDDFQFFSKLLTLQNQTKKILMLLIKLCKLCTQTHFCQVTKPC